MRLATAWYWIRNNAVALSAVSALIGGLVGGAWSAGRAMGTLTAPITLDGMEKEVEALNDKVRGLASVNVERRMDVLTDEVQRLATVSVAVTSEQLDEAVEPLVTELDLLRNAHRETESRVERLIGRRWYNVTGVRRDDRCYVNNTDYPLEIAVSTDAQSGAENFCQLDIFVEDELILQQVDNNPSYAKHCGAMASVPPRARYHVNDDGYKGGRIVMWWELRVAGETMDQIQDAQCR